VTSRTASAAQRIAIARALAARPRVIILDESVAALDVSIQAQILNLLADILDATGVHHGRVVERGPTAQVLDAPREEYTQLLRASVPRPGWTPRRRTRPREPSA